MTSKATARTWPGIIGARGNNDRGIAGLCWSVKIVAVRVLDADGRGTWSQRDRRHRLRDQGRREGHQRLLRRAHRLGDRPRRDPASQEQGRAAGGRRRQRRRQRRHARRPSPPPTRTATSSPSPPPTARTSSRRSPTSAPRPSTWPPPATTSPPPSGSPTTRTCRARAWRRRTSPPPPRCCARSIPPGDVGDISSRLRKKGNALKALKGKTASGKRLNINSALG